MLLKGDARAHASEAPVALREAEARLAAGHVRGVQIRYRWDGAEWRDTLLRGPTSVRVVRMRMPSVVSSDP